MACCNPIPPLIRQYINEVHKIILDSRAKELSEMDSTEDSFSTKKQDVSVDLTNDYMFDHHDKQEHSEHHHHQESPLLQWDERKCKFITTVDLSPMVEPMDCDKPDKLSISDMFESNLTSHIEKVNYVRLRKNAADTLLDNCISPYQRVSTLSISVKAILIDFLIGSI